MSSPPFPPGFIKGFLMRLLAVILLRICILWSGALGFFFSPPIFAYMGNVCLSPLEQAVLFSGTGSRSSGKTSYKSKIRSLNASISVIERRIEKQENKLKQATDKLANSLNGRKLGQDADEVADSVTDYMKYEQNGWGCQEDSSGSAFLYPSFLPGVFGPFLPLLLESTPVYAVDSIRKVTVQFFPNASPKKPEDCRKVGGTWMRSPANTCDMITVWNECKQYENRDLGYKGVTDQGECVCADDKLCTKVQGQKSNEEINRRQEALRNRKITECKKEFPGLNVVDARGTQCLCKEDRRGPKVPCENLKRKRAADSADKIMKEKGKKAQEARLTRLKREEAMKTCRKRHKEADITKAVSTSRGVYCYCGDTLCSTIFSKCKAEHGRFFTHIDSSRKCMCGEDPCSARQIGGRLQKCINKNKDIYPSGVTLGTDGRTCQCGNQSCDELRRKKIRECKEYENFGYTEFKSGQCMCGNRRCKDKKKENKSERVLSQKCVEKFPGLIVTRGFQGAARGLLNCDCLHKGEIKNCRVVKKLIDQERKAKNQTDCLNQYGKHRSTGVRAIIFKAGKGCLCDGKRCDLLGDPQPPQKHETEYQKNFKKCKEKYETVDITVIQYNNDQDKCICRFPNGKKGPCDNPPQTQGTDADDEDDSARDLILVPLPDAVGDGTEGVSTIVEDDEEPIQVDDGTPCKNWQKKKYFKRKGRVKDRAFCSDFAFSADCGEAFEDIRKQLEALRKLAEKKKEREKLLSQWEDKQFDAQWSDDEEEEDSATEASGLCVECLAELRSITGPSIWQRMGSGLSIALGAGLSVFGLHEARRSQRQANEMLALQGFPAENNFGYSMASLSLGYPLVSQGLYGFTHGNASQGSYACGHSSSPYPHSYPSYPVF